MSVIRVDVKPEMLRWAWERAGYDLDSLAGRIPQLPSWYQGEERPTLKQLEGFAKATHASVGYLFLTEPPVERIPIPDLRTMGGGRIKRPSPDLLDTLSLCQQRQEWYRDYARTSGEAPLSFVRSVAATADVEVVAADLRQALGFDLDERRRAATWTDTLRSFIEQADALGVLVMISGIVGNNTHRKLDAEEFRGFALVDDLAPLVFINGADTKAAQMFTLAHEFAHVWLAVWAESSSGQSMTRRWAGFAPSPGEVAGTSVSRSPHGWASVLPGRWSPGRWRARPCTGTPSACWASPSWGRSATLATCWG